MIYVRDDLGKAWFFDGERIKIVGDDDPDGGYDAESLEDGIEQLNRYGYITPPVEQVDQAGTASAAAKDDLLWLEWELRQS